MGRYTRVPREESLYKMCDKMKVEDDIHVLFEQMNDFVKTMEQKHCV